MGAFAVQRPDGRSDRAVILELVQDAQPGTIFEYDELQARLQAGVTALITRERAGQAARAANRTLLPAHRRYLDNVRGLGYRLIPAGEHRLVSVRRQTRAEREIKRGIEVVRHVRLEELDETQRRLAEGQLIVMNGLFMMCQSQQERQDRMDRLFQGLEERMRRLEGLDD